MFFFCHAFYSCWLHHVGSLKFVNIYNFIFDAYVYTWTHKWWKPVTFLCVISNRLVKCHYWDTYFCIKRENLANDLHSSKFKTSACTGNRSINLVACIKTFNSYKFIDFQISKYGYVVKMDMIWKQRERALHLSTPMVIWARLLQCVTCM